MDFGALKLTGIGRRRGRGMVLEDVSLDIPPGRSCALLGRAGSGKSALMRLLAGFDSPSSGIIELGGQPLDGIKPHRRDVGVVQQPDALLPDLTLAENIGLPLVIRGLKTRHRRGPVETVLEQMGLLASAELRPAQASPAERQRAVLARACVFGPRLLLLDEPFSLQDARERQALTAALRQIQLMLGATLVFATSDPALALGLADQIAVLRHGRIEQAGTAQDVFDRPDNEFVASALGETNRLDGQIQALEDDIATVRLACGPTIEARACGPVSPGQPCRVCLRPRQIALAEGPASYLGGSALDATVIETQYAGAEMRLRLLIGAGTALIVVRPTASGASRFAAGDQAAIAWQPHHAIAFARPLV